MSHCQRATIQFRNINKTIDLVRVAMDSAQAKIFAENVKGCLINGWSVGSTLGYGKSAVVMRAQQGNISAAIKIFHPELIERYGEERQIGRITRECSLIGKKHPHLVEIYDGGKCSATGNLFVVMELVSERNIKQELDRIPYESTWPIIQQLASAAMFLEEHGLVHRDIKPENISISNDLANIKLLDLGVLRPFGESDLTDVDERPFIGTLRYSSPEFLQRKESPTLEGWRALTIYQIGAVLHDLLMKKEIFREYSSPYSILVNAINEFTPDVYGDDVNLVRLCRHCLTKNPKTRFDIVSWGDFKKPIDNETTIEAMRLRIKERQRHFNDLAQTASIGAAELLRLQKRNIQDLCSRLSAAIGIVLNDLNFFPLRKIVETSSPDGSVYMLLVHFEQSAESGIYANLHVAFKLILVDANLDNPIYQVSSCALLSNVERAVEEVECSDKLRLGEGDEVVDQTILKKYFLSCLEAAYQYGESSGTKLKIDPTILTIPEA
jgi:serine/threonine protein kinase